MRIAAAALIVLTLSCNLFAGQLNDKEKQLQAFITAHVAKVAPMSKEANLTYWSAATTGNETDYKKFSEQQFEIQKIYMNHREFEFLKGLKQSGQIKDAILSRQLSKLYFAYLTNQIDEGLLKQITDLSTKVEENFSTFPRGQSGQKGNSQRNHGHLKDRT